MVRINEDGCGCKQPNKIKKEGLATLYAEWDNIDGLGPEDNDKLNLRITPEQVIKILDVYQMKMSLLWDLVLYGQDLIGWFVKH